MSLEATFYLAVVPGLVLTSSSVLFSLLSLGLPGQQQCPQVISLFPPSLSVPCTLSVPFALTALGPHNSSSPLLCPLSFVLSQRHRLFPSTSQAGTASPVTMTQASISHRCWEGGSQRAAQKRALDSWEDTERGSAHTCRKHGPLPPDFNHSE